MHKKVTESRSEFMKIKKIAENAMLVIGTVVILWMAFSWIDTICHNAMPNPQYSPLNLLAMVIRGGR